MGAVLVSTTTPAMMLRLSFHTEGRLVRINNGLHVSSTAVTAEARHYSAHPHPSSLRGAVRSHKKQGQEVRALAEGNSMAARKVHGSVFSTATMRVLSCLHEKGLPFDFVAVDMKSGAHKKDDFLAMNPFGQVPVMEDGDLAIFESRAITQHIAREYQSQGTPLVFPDDGAKMTTLTVWMEVEAQQFDQPASKLVFEYVFKPFLGIGTTDEAVVAEHEAKLRKVLDVYEARLAKNEYLSGGSFGLADLHQQPLLHFLAGTPAKKLFDERPNVSRWVGAVLGRPAWEKVVAMQKSQQ